MHTRLAIAALTLAAACTPTAQASTGPGLPSAVQCGDSFLRYAEGYVACQGPLVGNITPLQNNAVTFAGHGSFRYAGTAGDDSGSFADNPAGSSIGTLGLGAVQGGLFVVGLQAGSAYSLYLFNGAAVQGGLGALDFDTDGIFNGSSAGGPLSSAVLFAQAVPEPGSVALMLAGLGALGLIVRRRRAD